jgi:hypothetical protein
MHCKSLDTSYMILLYEVLGTVGFHYEQRNVRYSPAQQPNGLHRTSLMQLPFTQALGAGGHVTIPFQVPTSPRHAGRPSKTAHQSLWPVCLQRLEPGWVVGADAGTLRRSSRHLKSQSDPTIRRTWEEKGRRSNRANLSHLTVASHLNWSHSLAAHRSSKLPRVQQASCGEFIIHQPTSPPAMVTTKSLAQYESPGRLVATCKQLLPSSSSPPS